MSTPAPHARRILPAPGRAWVWGLLAALLQLGCPAGEEGFEAEIHLTSVANQSPFDEVDRLEITFEYAGEESKIFPLSAPFDEPPVLEDLPRGDAGDVSVVVRGQVQDASADGGWRTVADGTAGGFAMPPEGPIEILVLMKGAIALMPGGLDDARSDGTAFLLDDGRVVVIGGGDGETTVPGVELLLADSEDRYRGQSVAELPRMAHAAFLIEDSGTDFDGRVVVVGGDTECGDFVCFNNVNPAETTAYEVVAFDPDGDDLDVISSLVYGRIGGKPARLVDGSWAIDGGFDEDGGYPVFPYIFDPAGGGVGWADSESDGREQHTATAVDVGNGKVLIAGGIVNNELQDSALLWSNGPEAMATGSLNQARMRHTATSLPGGGVLIAGGATGQYFDSEGIALSSVEIYDPEGGVFLPVEPGLNHARQRHIAIPVGGGEAGILVCGGVDKPGDEGSPVLTCEILSLDTGEFETHAGLELVAGGEGMMGVPLPDGSVLLMGGLASGEPVDEVHLYYP